jgi:hypothetical protein
LDYKIVTSKEGELFKSYLQVDYTTEEAGVYKTGCVLNTGISSNRSIIKSFIEG